MRDRAVTLLVAQWAIRPNSVLNTQRFIAARTLHSRARWPFSIHPPFYSFGHRLFQCFLRECRFENGQRYEERAVTISEGHADFIIPIRLGTCWLHSTTRIQNTNAIRFPGLLWLRSTRSDQKAAHRSAYKRPPVHHRSPVREARIRQYYLCRSEFAYGG